MKLIGMMDSPYVRRVAISARLLGIAHAHDQVSVFRHMDAFAKINPVIKAPTLICDDGGTIMDSTLILDYFEALAAPGKSLMPNDIAARQKVLSLIGLALALCEKAVQIEYERKRPGDKQYGPWFERVSAQLYAACAGLEAACAQANPRLVGGELSQADVSVAVAWTFGQFITGDVVRPADYPEFAAFASQMEMLEPFRLTPLE